MGKIRNWLRRYKPEEPLRLVANVRQQNRIANVLEDIEGIGCRIEKPQNLEGMGWKIVVGDGGDAENPDGSTPGAYQFEVVRFSDTSVKVRGGWWAYYVGEVRTQEDLAVAGADFENLTGELSPSGTGVIYLELDTDEAATTPAPTLTAKFATDAAWAALVDTAEIYRLLLASVEMTVGAVRDEDYATGFGIQKGLSTGANEEFTFGKNELGLHKFHQWVDYYAEGKPEAERPNP